jgi:predicted secreted Zn-dependent protease
VAVWACSANVPSKEPSDTALTVTFSASAPAPPSPTSTEEQPSASPLVSPSPSATAEGIACLVDDPLLQPISAVQLAAACDYYVVTGSKASQLRESLNSERPRDGSKRYDAKTTWYIAWRYALTLSPNGSRCEATHVTVSLSVTVIFPEWSDQSRATPALRKHWRSYMVALGTHEAGHERIAISGANDTVRAIEALGAFDSCLAAAKGANTAGDAVADTVRARQRQYDSATQHGATQGATFP